VLELQRRVETVRARSSAIELDLSEIEFIDSSGMALLIRASQAAKNEGGGSVSAARSLHKSNVWYS
jgi:anti-anti-sigma factor